MRQENKRIFFYPFLANERLAAIGFATDESNVSACEELDKILNSYRATEGGNIRVDETGASRMTLSVCTESLEQFPLESMIRRYKVTRQVGEDVRRLLLSPWDSKTRHGNLTTVGFIPSDLARPYGFAIADESQLFQLARSIFVV